MATDSGQGPFGAGNCSRSKHQQAVKLVWRDAMPAANSDDDDDEDGADWPRSDYDGIENFIMTVLRDRPSLTNDSGRAAVLFKKDLITEESEDDVANDLMNIFDVDSKFLDGGIEERLMNTITELERKNIVHLYEWRGDKSDYLIVLTDQGDAYLKSGAVSSPEDIQATLFDRYMEMLKMCYKSMGRKFLKESLTSPGRDAKAVLAWAAKSGDKEFQDAVSNVFFPKDTPKKKAKPARTKAAKPVKPAKLKGKKP
jgi:hypothetical protein